jgi:hypothetical protein
LQMTVSLATDATRNPIIFVIHAYRTLPPQVETTFYVGVCSFTYR